MQTPGAELNKPTPWVVKIGGSLADTPALHTWLEELTSHGGRVIIVPGGGPFADQVRRTWRQLQFPEAAAHHMAVLAMEQYGLMLCSLAPKFTPAHSMAELQQHLHQGETPLWMPARMTRSLPLPHNWSVTSDSLALYLAQQFTPPQLALIKAKPPPETPTTEIHHHPGLLDQAFPEIWQTPPPQTRARVLWLGPHHAPRFSTLLNNPRTTAGTELLLTSTP